MPRATLHRAGLVGLLAAPLLLAAIPGCGYRFSPKTTGVLPDDARSVAVPVFSNDTHEANLGTIFTRALIVEFERVGNLPVRSKGSADYVLEGTMHRLVETPVAFSSIAVVLQTRVTITLSVKIRRRSDREIIYELQKIRLVEEYDITPDANVTKSNKADAVRKVAADTADRIANAIFHHI